MSEEPGGADASPAGEPPPPSPGEAPTFRAEAGSGEKTDDGANGTDTASPPLNLEDKMLVLPPPPVPPVVPRKPGTPESPLMAAWRRFYERTELTAEDARVLWTKRGLTLETCKAFGFRSSLRRYKDVLQEMKEHFRMAVLLESGLWKQGEKPGDPPVPNPMYYGWGVVGKIQMEDDDPTPGSNGAPRKKKSEMKWDWTMPILIPYRDKEGRVVFIRPHKGNPKGGMPRLYIARPSAPVGPNEYDFAVITEGEFKVAALWQALDGRVCIVGLPGITMAKLLFGDIEDLMDEALEGGGAR